MAQIKGKSLGVPLVLSNLTVYSSVISGVDKSDPYPLIKTFKIVILKSGKMASAHKHCCTG